LEGGEEEQEEGGGEEGVIHTAKNKPANEYIFQLIIFCVVYEG
jgi:hypothetical protein